MNKTSTWHVTCGDGYSHFRLLYIPDTSIEPLESFLNPEFQMSDFPKKHICYMFIKTKTQILGCSLRFQGTTVGLASAFAGE